MLARAQKTSIETRSLKAKIQELEKELEKYKKWYDIQANKIREFEEMFAAIPEGYTYDPVNKEWDINWRLKQEDETPMQTPSGMPINKEELEQKDDDPTDEEDNTALPPIIYDSSSDESSDGTSSDGSSNQGDEYNTAEWFNELMASYTKALNPPAYSQAILFPFQYGNFQKPAFIGDTLKVSGNTTITYYTASLDEWTFNQELGSNVDPKMLANMIKSFGPSIVFVLVNTTDQLSELIGKVMLSPLPFGCDRTICANIKETLQKLIDILHGQRQTRYQSSLKADEELDILPSPLFRDEETRKTNNPWLNEKKNYFLELWLSFDKKEKFNLTAYEEHYNRNPEEVTNMWRDFYQGYWQHYRDTWSNRYPVTITDWVEYTKWRVNTLSDEDKTYSEDNGLDWNSRTLVADPYSDVVSMNYGPYSLLVLLHQFKQDIGKFWQYKQLATVFKANVNQNEGEAVLGKMPHVIADFFFLEGSDPILGEQWDYIKKKNKSIKFQKFGLFPSTEIETNAKFSYSNRSVFDLVKNINYKNILQSLRVPTIKKVDYMKDVIELKRQLMYNLINLKYELSDRQQRIVNRGELENCPLTWIGKNDSEADFKMKMDYYTKWKKEKEDWLNNPLKQRQAEMSKAYNNYINKIFNDMADGNGDVEINGYRFANVDQLEKFSLERGVRLDVLFGECVDLVLDDLVN